MQVKEWKINKSDEAKPLIERLLYSRGIKTQGEIETFLNPLSIKLTHPNAFCDMQKAVSRIVKAIDNNENILIYGDFDADGLTSTSLMVKTLTHIGANVSYYIPKREGDGHGLNSNALVKLMVTQKPKLIITVDCGISNLEEVKFINSFNIDVIITDHHEAPEELPEALAIINPKAPNALDEKLTALEIHYLTSLAGVGVAFKVAQALLEKYEKLTYIYEILPYVAVGTIADVVPLIGENRYYVVKGLDLISKGKHYGLKRLLDNAGYSNIEDGITSEQVAFGIAPRINASGRLDAVDDAIKVLISENRQEIEMSVIALENFNKVRQELCHNTFLEADEMAKKEKDNTLVLFKPDWHLGIIGIVASKLVEKYHKPTFLMTYSEETKQIRCSARGVEGVSALNLYDIISNISDKLDGFGGHTLAAGLSFSTETVTFEEVKKGLIDTVNEALAGEKIIPVLNIDMEVKPNDISIETIEELKQLEPYGASNPQPIFAMKDLILKEKKLMGSNKEHLKLILEKDNQVFNAIWWSKGDISLSNGDLLDIAFYPQINVFNNTTSVQLILKDIHSESLKEIESEDIGIKIYDHRNKTDIYKQVNDYLKTTRYNTTVFAEDKSIIDKLKIYPEIASRIKNRNSISKSDTVMFFDYPASSEIYESILKISEPSIIHYMNYEVNHSVEEYIKTIYGMIKFVSNNKNGEFNLINSSVFLGVTITLIELTLSMFEEGKIIKISDKKDTSYTIQLLEHVDISSISKLDSYIEFTLEFSTINGFKNMFQKMDLNNLNICMVKTQ